MFSYYTISTDDDQMQLSALVDIKDYTKYHMPSLTLSKELNISWDSEPYLVTKVYPYLKNDLINLEKSCIADGINFEEVIQEFDGIFSSYKSELLEMFDMAFSIGLLKMQLC